jgi:hypothetical protein
VSRTEKRTGTPSHRTGFRAASRPTYAADADRAKTAENSYMLPHGGRITARPRARTEPKWSRSARTVSATPIRPATSALGLPPDTPGPSRVTRSAGGAAAGGASTCVLLPVAPPTAALLVRPREGAAGVCCAAAEKAADVQTAPGRCPGTPTPRRRRRRRADRRRRTRAPRRRRSRACPGTARAPGDASRKSAACAGCRPSWGTREPGTAASPSGRAHRGQRAPARPADRPKPLGLADLRCGFARRGIAMYGRIGKTTKPISSHRGSLAHGEIRSGATPHGREPGSFADRLRTNLDL